MSKHKPQLRIPATYMRGGTSKGVFSVLLICQRLLSSQAKSEMLCSFESLVAQTRMANKPTAWAERRLVPAKQ